MADLTLLLTTVREFGGDLSSAQFSDAQLTRYINFGLGEVSKRTGQIRATTSYAALDGVTVDGVGGVSVPADFFQEIEVRWNGYRLERMRYDEFFLRGDNIEFQSSAPTHYTITPFNVVTGVRRIIFYPYQALTQAGALQLYYVAKMPVLVAGADVPKVPEVLHEAIVFYATHLLKTAEGDYEGSKYFRGLFNQVMTDWETYQVEGGYNENPQVKEYGYSLQYLYDTTP